MDNQSSFQVKNPNIKPSLELPTLLAILACLLLIGSAVILASKSFFQTKLKLKHPFPPAATNQPTQTLPPKLTADWKTYKTAVGIEFKSPDNINVCDFQNNVLLEYKIKSLCQDTLNRKKSLLTYEELNTAVNDFRGRVNNQFTDTVLSIEYDGDRSKITSFNEIISKDNTKAFAWFAVPEGYYYVEIYAKKRGCHYAF